MLAFFFYPSTNYLDHFDPKYDFYSIPEFLVFIFNPYFLLFRESTQNSNT